MVDVTAVIISAIGAFVSLGTVALTILLNKKLDKVAKEVDGKMAQLLTSTGAAKKAEGKEEQKEEAATTAEDVVEAIKLDPDINVTKSK